MQDAILFESNVNDSLIRIPEAYRDFFKKDALVSVKVSAASKPASPKAPLTENSFTAIKLDTNGWKLSRDEANERR